MILEKTKGQVKQISCEIEKWRLSRSGQHWREMNGHSILDSSYLNEYLHVLLILFFKSVETRKLYPH